VAQPDRVLQGLGKALHAAREKQGFTQESLSLETGVHRNYIGGIERGERSPSVAAVAKLADALVSPHSLRRTYASLRYACGDDPVYVAEQGGWADPAFPIKVYAKAVRRRERLSGTHREAFDAALDWAAMGGETEADPAQSSPQEGEATGATAQ
jgi:transcriptional regulator with XRE-family HTH domain